MALEIIGAGFGRTGTLSLKQALEQLGFGPCYHMVEVYNNPEHVASWSQAVAGEAVDWSTLFAGYRAAIDWPAAAFWGELLAVWPHAKVILTLRDPDAWLRSMHNTIISSLRGPMPEDPVRREQRLVNRRLILQRVFGGQIDDREHAIAVFNQNLETVRARVPAGQLLEYSPGDGWGPLCRFLDVPVPEEDYPHVNSSEQFGRRWGQEKAP